MKSLLVICGLTAAMTLGDTLVQQWIGSNAVAAQGSSACIQNCMNVRRWPEAQCREYCAKQEKQRR
jgi:hypothetical protein